MKKVELVFVPSPFTGHMFSTTEFAKYLLGRDERLSVTILVMESPFKPISMEQLIDSNSNIRFIDIPRGDPPPEEMKSSLEKYISDYIENQKPNVKDAIVNQVLSDSVPVAGLVYDVFCSSMIDVASELGIPSYAFFTSGAAYLGLLFHLPLHYDQTGRKLLLSDPDSNIPSFANPVPSRVFPCFALNDEGNFVSFMNHAIRMKKSKGIIINTFQELEPHAVESLTSDSTTPPIYTTGPVLHPASHDKSSEAEKIIQWLDKQPPASVVFLCFGSMGQLEPPELAEIATALEQNEHRFLWSVRMPQPKATSDSGLGDFASLSNLLPNGFTERAKDRGMVCGWAPQVEVLAHEAVGGFVSHCGWNSTLESIWHGVPIATWPLYAEQQTNAFLMVKELELAVELKLDFRMENSGQLVMADEISKAISSLMDSENPVRKRVKEISEKSRKAIADGGSSLISLGRLIDDILAKEV